MKKSFLGIDIGTSSIKALLLFEDGKIIKNRISYSENSLLGIKNAVKQALKKFKKYHITAISFSSQVGTYVLDDKDIIWWNSSSGKEQLDFIKSKCSKEEFIDEISMDHPEIISYPLPRFLFIKEKYSTVKKVCGLKDYFIEQLTGEYLTDCFSMRGISNIERKEYANNLLNKFEISFDLPKILSEKDLCGHITEKAEKEYKIKQGTPVYLGCNDFFAGILGMGVLKNNQFFDVSGTSEHIGVITENLIDTKMVSGPYFSLNTTYGGTKASGLSCKFAMDNFSLENLDFQEELDKNPPIFLPYLTGERAPIFDENAKGVFFGITDKTDKKSLAYSVLEGVLFSLYDIAQNLGDIEIKNIICGGGSAINNELTKMKAELFNANIINVVENDISALGAAIIAMVGNGFAQNYDQAVEKYVKYFEEVKPLGKNREKLLKRFGLYRSIYQNLKNTFVDFKEI